MQRGKMHEKQQRKLTTMSLHPHLHITIEKLNGTEICNHNKTSQYNHCKPLRAKYNLDIFLGRRLHGTDTAACHG